MGRTLSVLVVGLACLAVGCGGSSTETTETVDTAAQERAERERERERKAEQRRIRQQEEHDACQSAMGPLMRKLGALQSRLAVGLNYEAYGEAVGSARVVYDRIDYSEVGGVRCLTTVGLSLERALNQYATAAGIWTDCFTDIYCEMDTIDPQLQEKWSSAGRSLDKADRNLERLAPDT